MDRRGARTRARVAAARGSSSDRRPWSRLRTIRVHPQAARHPAAGRGRYIHRNADRRDRSAKPWVSLKSLLEAGPWRFLRSEEHTSELQSRLHLVCRLLLEKKKKKKNKHNIKKKQKKERIKKITTAKI